MNRLFRCLPIVEYDFRNRYGPQFLQRASNHYDIGEKSAESFNQ